MSLVHSAAAAAAAGLVVTRSTVLGQGQHLELVLMSVLVLERELVLVPEAYASRKSVLAASAMLEPAVPLHPLSDFGSGLVPLAACNAQPCLVP
jgi:hypothetical protein